MFKSHQLISSTSNITRKFLSNNNKLTIPVPPLIQATGGTITDIVVGGTNYRLHTFTTVGNSTFTITEGEGQIDVFIVGGGGGGGMLGGGGGGGGIIWASNSGLTPGSYTITVGDGGAGEVGWTSAVRDGDDSSAFGLTAFGGGGGLSYSGSFASINTNVANTGGNRYSQTGNTAGATAMTISGGWTGTTYGGYLGGGGDANCCSCRGGGGAGAGANGSAFSASAGGIGVQLNFDGNNYYWAGGGGNDGYCSNNGGNGGLGGGGGGSGVTGGTGGGSARNSGANGVSATNNGNGGAGGANTGGGGGAGSNGSGSTSITGGKGGSGIVMIRYRR